VEEEEMGEKGGMEGWMEEGRKRKLLMYLQLSPYCPSLSTSQNCCL
jgi:hypothetical protein